MSVATEAVEVNRLLGGALLMTFSASMLNMATFIGAGATTVHLSGATAKAGLYLAAHEWTKMEPQLGIPLCFFVGALAAGFSTSRKEWKNLETCTVSVFIVGVLACVAGAMMEEGHVEGIYVAALGAGLQNAMLTTITGFVRSTHVTGTWTDIGLLLGQAFPDKMGDRAHWWKTKILSLLLVAFYVGGVVSEFINDAIPGKLAYVAGGVSFAVSMLGAAHCYAKRRATAAVAVEDDAEKELNAVVPASDVESGKSPTFKRLVKRNVLAVNRGMDALLEISKEMAGNINSMPDPPEKVVATAMAVNKAAKIFKSRSQNAKSVAEALQGVSEEDVSDAQNKLGAVCHFLVNRPELMEELEKTSGAVGVRAFVASAAVPYAADR